MGEGEFGSHRPWDIPQRAGEYRGHQDPDAKGRRQGLPAGDGPCQLCQSDEAILGLCGKYRGHMCQYRALLHHISVP